jgi:hypothetical protein
MDTRSSSAEDISGWLTPRRALEILDSVFHETNLSKHELLQRLRGGMVRAICHQTSIDGRQIKAHMVNKLGSEDWDHIYSNDEFWITGTHSGSTYREYGGYNPSKPIRFFDVRFNPDDINAIVAPHQAHQKSASEPVAPSETVATLNKGGAPRKEWWDDFWIAICGQIWEGDLKPNSQAELERVMLDWASQNGHDMSETSAKVAARKLFRAWKLGDKN